MNLYSFILLICLFLFENAHRELSSSHLTANPLILPYLQVIKKLSKAFKNFEKFFTDVKKSLDIASQRFEENGMSWNKIGYYGFR